MKCGAKRSKLFYNVPSITSVINNTKLKIKDMFEEYNKEEEEGNKAFVIDRVIELFTDDKLTEMAFEKYPRVIQDDYNPMEDANEDYRDIYIQGAKDLLSAL